MLSTYCRNSIVTVTTTSYCYTAYLFSQSTYKTTHEVHHAGTSRNEAALLHPVSAKSGLKAQ